MAQIFPIDFEEKLIMAQDDYILFSDSEDGNKIKKAQYKNLKGEKGDPGTPGTPGQDGEDGAAATITVGSVSTLPAGSSATVTNSGTTSAAVLNFGIPEGATGTPGTDGQDGAAATITVGTTTTLPAGSSATVTNVGTSQDAILNFGIPKGDQGVGSGDVNGPASSTDGDVAIFDGNTGKLIKDGSVALSTLSSAASLATTAIQPGDDISDLNNDSGFITGITSSDVTNALGYTPYDSSNPSGYTTNTGDVVGPGSSTDGHLALFDGATGKLIKDGGAVPTGVPTVGTDGQVLTVVSGSAAWAAPSGGDVLVSDQANNIFTSGMKIWGGTISDFNDLTPDSNTAYLLLADQPTPPSPGWQPGADTVAYWKFDGDMDDYSGNNYNLSGTPTSYVTLTSGLKVAQFNASDSPSSPGNLNSSPILDVMQNNNRAFTYSVYVNVATWGSADNNQTYILYGQGVGSYRVTDMSIKPSLMQIGLGAGAGSDFAHKDFSTTNSLDTRYHVVFTRDGSSTVRCYMNGTEIGTGVTTNAWTNWTAYDTGWIGYCNGWDNGQDIKLSNFIIEKKCWTAQEISDYFDQTKANYGIS